MNKTPPLADESCSRCWPPRSTAVTAFGPHVAGLAARFASTARSRAPKRRPGDVPAAQLTSLLRRVRARRDPLPLLPGRYVRERLDTGWDPERPAAPGQAEPTWPARQDSSSSALTGCRSYARIEETLGLVGAEKHFGRSAAIVTGPTARAPCPGPSRCTSSQAARLVGVVRTAAIIVIPAVSGMRASEVMELRVGCRRAEESGPGLVRYRIASNVVKGQPLGGTQDEWVVIEPVYQAVGLAEQLHDDPRDGAPLFGRFEFGDPLPVVPQLGEQPGRAAAGLAPIPADPVTPRDAPANAGDRACLPARRPARRKDFT